MSIEMKETLSSRAQVDNLAAGCFVFLVIPARQNHRICPIIRQMNARLYVHPALKNNALDAQL